jgi:hypothetical protein
MLSLHSEFKGHSAHHVTERIFRYYQTPKHRMDALAALEVENRAPHDLNWVVSISSWMATERMEEGE